MQKLTSSIYDFETLIEHSYLYVDKTAYLWKMIQNYGESYFLARPRRFGKSLTVSTLKAIFEGKRELFDGLAISQVDYDWEKYPVIHLSFADMPASVNTFSGVKDYLNEKVKQTADQFAVAVTAAEPGMRLGQLIDALNRKSKVVVLIDEYDKPLIDNIQNQQAEAIREELKGLYGVLKDRNSALRMLFLTGVTKFSHVSLFSGINNLTDISMDYDYAPMLGYTQSEVEKYFAEYIDSACQAHGMSRDKMLAEIKKWYNGYRFHGQAESVYNPVSLAQFFTKRFDFSNYWFATGTPSFLVKIAQEKNFSIEKTLTEPVSSFAFDAFDVDRIEPLALLLQTGYLTIKSSGQIFSKNWYQLGFPNHEVEESFNTYLLNAYTSVDKEITAQNVIEMAQCVDAGDAEKFMDCVKTYFANIPYDIQLANEKYYQTVFYLLFRALKLNIEAEVCTNNGRIDAVAEYGKNIFIFEFKINQTAEIALAQIKEKEYYQKYKHSGKDITLIGANFDTELRQLTDWKIQKV